MEDLRVSLEKEKEEEPWSKLFLDPSVRKRVLIAKGLQWKQKFTGMNALLSLGPSILKAAPPVMHTEVAQMIINLCNRFVTILMMLLVARYGQRGLYCSSARPRC